MSDNSSGVHYGEGRKALLEAVIRVTASKGLRGLTYRAVAEAAGVTHGLVAHHFGSRDALIEEALDFAAQTSIDRSRLESSDPGFDGLAAELQRSVTLRPDVEAFQYELILESRRRPELLPLVERIYAAYRRAITEELGRNGLEDSALAHLVMAATDGLVLQQLAFGRPEMTDGALARGRELGH
jgi:AcrR family transcriptional regulator